MPQLGHAMCGSAGAPQLGQVTVAAAWVFQLARREWVLAREVLYFGSAILSSVSIEYFELKRRAVYRNLRSFASLAVVAGVLLLLQTLLESLQGRPAVVHYLVVVIGMVIQIHAALGAQAPAVGSAQGLQG